MKEVIKHGKPEYIKAKTYKLECPNCFCVFTYSHGDLEWQARSIDGQAGVKCPDCNYEIVFRPFKHLFHVDNEE